MASQGPPPSSTSLNPADPAGSPAYPPGFAAPPPPPPAQYQQQAQSHYSNFGWNPPGQMYPPPSGYQGYHHPPPPPPPPSHSNHPSHSFFPPPHTNHGASYSYPPHFNHAPPGYYGAYQPIPSNYSGQTFGNQYLSEYPISSAPSFPSHPLNQHQPPYSQLSPPPHSTQPSTTTASHANPSELPVPVAAIAPSTESLPLPPAPPAPAPQTPSITVSSSSHQTSAPATDEFRSRLASAGAVRQGQGVPPTGLPLSHRVNSRDPPDYAVPVASATTSSNYARPSLSASGVAAVPLPSYRSSVASSSSSSSNRSSLSLSNRSAATSNSSNPRRVGTAAGQRPRNLKDEILQPVLRELNPQREQTHGRRPKTSKTRDVGSVLKKQTEFVVISRASSRRNQNNENEEWTRWINIDDDGINRTQGQFFDGTDFLRDLRDPSSSTQARQRNHSTTATSTTTASTRDNDSGTDSDASLPHPSSLRPRSQRHPHASSGRAALPPPPPQRPLSSVSAVSSANASQRNPRQPLPLQPLRQLVTSEQRAGQASYAEDDDVIMPPLEVTTANLPNRSVAAPPPPSASAASTSSELLSQARQINLRAQAVASESQPRPPVARHAPTTPSSDPQMLSLLTESRQICHNVSRKTRFVFNNEATLPRHLPPGYRESVAEDNSKVNFEAEAASFTDQLSALMKQDISLFYGKPMVTNLRRAADAGGPRHIVFTQLLNTLLNCPETTQWVRSERLPNSKETAFRTGLLAKYVVFQFSELPVEFPLEAIKIAQSLQEDDFVPIDISSRLLALSADDPHRAWIKDLITFLDEPDNVGEPILKSPGLSAFWEVIVENEGESHWPSGFAYKAVPATVEERDKLKAGVFAAFFVKPQKPIFAELLRGWDSPGDSWVFTPPSTGSTPTELAPGERPPPGLALLTRLRLQLHRELLTSYPSLLPPSRNKPIVTFLSEVYRGIQTEEQLEAFLSRIELRPSAVVGGIHQSRLPSPEETRPVPALATFTSRQPTP
ncbi:hypothetical protein JCM5353_008943 [Sporobolomyces roseus]